MSQCARRPPLEALISYAHRDEKLKDELRKHLSMLKRQGIISEWHDRAIDAGADWSKEIDTHLESAKIILLLISPDFLASDYCYNIEMKRAMERHDRGEACVVPIFLRQCDWKGAPFGKLQGLPTDAKPITSPRWSSHDEAFAIVARGIRTAVETLQAPIPPTSASGHRYGDLFAFLKEMLYASSPPPSERVLERWQFGDTHASSNEPHGSRTIPIPITPKVEAWLAAYDQALSARGDASRSRTRVASSYVEACTASLLARGTTHFARLAAVDKTGHSSLLEFVFEVHDTQSGCLFCHPCYSDYELVIGQRFLDGLDRAWALAASSDDGLNQSTVLWSVRSTKDAETDARSIDLDNSPAVGAAFRAFWHLRRRLYLDRNVYVLADCEIDGSIHTVGDITGMVKAIQHEHDSSSPATLVVAAGLRHDQAAMLDALDDWLETKRVNTIDALAAVRSGEADNVIVFLRHLTNHWDKTPWLRDGRPVLLSEVHVPPSVLKEELHRTELADELSSQQQDIGDESRPSNHEVGAGGREFGLRRAAPKRQVRVRWDEEFKRPNRTAPLVVIGSPGFGKTSLLAWTARQMAIDAKSQLEARTATPEEVQWPVLIDLDTWAWQPGLPQESLCAAVIKASELPEDWSDRRRATIEQITRERIRGHGANTFLFLDGLDQVGEARAALLRSRLSTFNSFSSRMIFSTRESGLRTLQPILPFPHLVYLETAGLSTEEADELAGRWLGSTKSIELNGYLRSHSSLSLVTDSPLLLTLACLVALTRTKSAFPSTVAALYREITRHLALGSWRRPSRFSLDTGDLEAFLGGLRTIAWYLFCVDPGANRFERVTLVSAVKRATEIRDKEANEAIARLVDLGFLEPTGEQNEELTYHFRHSTFREFLAAWYLAGQINGEGWNRAEVDFLDADGHWRHAKVSDLLDTNTFEANWEPLFMFSAGILNDPSELLRLLADSQNDDIQRHRLSLLCRCYGTLSPDKESTLTEVMQPVFKTIRAIGFFSLSRRPHRWPGWLADVGSLITLPIAGQRIINILMEMAGQEHERHMHNFGHDVIDLLAKTARGFHWQTSLNGLLNLCGSYLDHEIADAARHIVEIADSRGETGYTESLIRILVKPTEKPWRQVPIARAILRAANERSVQVALDFITKTMEDDTSEVWIKSAAMDALAEGLGTRRDAEVAALILEAWADPLTSSTSRYELGREVLRMAHKNHSDVIAILLVVVSGLCKYDAELTSSCAGLFAGWGHQMGLRRSVAHLWSLAKSPRIDCYPRIRALEGIIAHGQTADRAAAVTTLLEASAPPMSDGREQWLALDALLRAGEPYPGRIREHLRALVDGATVEPNWIVCGCELALDFGDRELVEDVTPRLLLIWAGKNPNESSKAPDWSNRKSVGKLLRGTGYWPELEASALAVLRNPDREAREDFGAVEIVAFSAASSTLLKLVEDLLAVGKPSFRPWHILLRELDQRGWRVQVLLNRRLRILRPGQEESRPDADLGW